MPGIVSYQFLGPDGSVLSSQNADTLVMPASNMKVVSGFSAYKLLGRNHDFETRFSIIGSKLIVSGDPTFLLSGPELQKIGNEIKAKSSIIKEIVLNTSCMDSSPYGSGWMIEDRKYTYQSKIAPFTVNEGSIPSGEVNVGKLIDPHSESLVPVQNQHMFFAQALWDAIEIPGKLRYVVGNETGGELLFKYTKPLTEVMRHIEEVSCNFSIEVLTKLISNKRDGRRGTWKRGIQEIYGVLKGMGLDTGEIKIVDGSGLSRLNLLSTNFLSNLVYRISKSNEKEFLKLLPSSGMGTLKSRLKTVEELGINAKTGSIAYCSSLTGFVEKLGVSFSIVINHSPEPDKNLPGKVDEILLRELQKLR